MKKFSAFLLILLLPALVFSATWHWDSQYNNIKGFRYQADGEDDASWIYVGPDTTSVTLSDDVETLFVQQTLDGITWSPSGFAKVEAEEEEKQQESIVVADDASEEILTRPFAFSLDLAYGAEVTESHFAPSLNLSFDFKNIIRFSNDVAAFNLRLSGGLTLLTQDEQTIFDYIQNGSFLSWAKYDKVGYGDLTFAFDMKIGSNDISLGIGAGFAGYSAESKNSMISLFDVNGICFYPYLVASATAKHYLGSVFFLGVRYDFRYAFTSDFLNGEMSHLGLLNFGFTF